MRVGAKGAGRAYAREPSPPAPYMGRELSSGLRCGQAKSFRASAVDALSRRLDACARIRPWSAMDFDGASPAPCAGSRAVEVHGETKPRRRGAVTRRADPRVQAGPSPGGSGGGASAPCTATGRRGPPEGRARDAVGPPRRWDGASLWLGGEPPCNLISGRRFGRSIILRAQVARPGMDRTNLSLGSYPRTGAVTGPIPDEANGL